MSTIQYDTVQYSMEVEGYSTRMMSYLNSWLFLDHLYNADVIPVYYLGPGFRTEVNYYYIDIDCV